MVVLVASLVMLTACAWPQFRSGPEHSGYQPFESKINTTNVSGLQQAWTATTGGYVLSSPAVANGVVYVGSADGKLYAFDAAGVTGCTGTPKSCNPLWTATVGEIWTSSPAVVNGVVYIGSQDHNLYAFDAAGVTGCSGTPKTCTPLWSAATGSWINSSPTVVKGVVYVGSTQPDGKLYAFDASGLTGCSGTPKTCTPLWTAATRYGIEASPAVANGVIYIGASEPDNTLYAFDAAGVKGCSGTPKSCTPMWIAHSDGGGGFDSSPSVVNGVVYVGSDYPELGKLYAFDAAGVSGCTGTPKTCTPLWTAATGSYIYSSPAVANGVVYIGSTEPDDKLYAFDAAGASGCSGTPKTCTPLWTATTAGGADSSPAVANGVVFVGEYHAGGGHLYAFDAAGTSGCSGTPKTCTPLWTATPDYGVVSSPAVANGVVYVGSYDKKLYAFAL